MTASTAQRVQRHRDSLRRAGLWPIQIWVPDTRRAGFDAECRHQSGLAAQTDSPELLDFLDAGLADLDTPAA